MARLAAGALGGSVKDWEGYYDPEKNPRLNAEQVYVLEEDGEIRASAAVLPLKVFVDGRPVQMGGVAAVATHAAYRRRGYAGELLRAALRGMRERSVHLSMLHPFAHAFYRRYGWELATEAISYELKPTSLPTENEQKHVRAYRDGDLHRMMVLLEGEASRYPLSVYRDEGRWRQLLDWGEQEAAVYEAEAGIEGYLLYELREGDGSPHTLVLSELIAATPAARRALISFAAAFDPLMFAVKYSASRGEPLHPYLENSYVNARLAPEYHAPPGGRGRSIEAAASGPQRTVRPRGDGRRDPGERGGIHHRGRRRGTRRGGIRTGDARCAAARPTLRRLFARRAARAAWAPRDELPSSPRDTRSALPAWRPLRLAAGSLLSQRRRGARSCREATSGPRTTLRNANRTALPIPMRPAQRSQRSMLCFAAGPSASARKDLPGGPEEHRPDF